MEERLEKRISGLGQLPKPELVLRFRRIFGKTPSLRASRDLLTLAIAYHLQDQVEGGLGDQARRRLNRHGSHPVVGGKTPRVSPVRFKPGTRLVRVWQGLAHQVTVMEDGFDYKGARFGSLSAIARSITGTRWSGPAFFELRRARLQEATNG